MTMEPCCRHNIPSLASVPLTPRFVGWCSRPRSFVNAVQLKPWLRLGEASFALHGRRFLSIARRNDRGGLNHEDHASFGRARTVHHSFWNNEALTRQKVDRARFEIDDEASA